MKDKCLFCGKTRWVSLFCYSIGLLSGAFALTLFKNSPDFIYFIGGGIFMTIWGLVFEYHHQGKNGGLK